VLSESTHGVCMHKQDYKNLQLSDQQGKKILNFKFFVLNFFFNFKFWKKMNFIAQREPKQQPSHGGWTKNQIHN